MAELIERPTCIVREGRFVDPCDTLAELIDNIAPGFSKTKGIAKWSYTNLKTHQPSRSFVGVKCRSKPNGFAFNFCPVCGTDISAPFTEPEEETLCAKEADNGKSC